MDVAFLSSFFPHIGLGGFCLFLKSSFIFLLYSYSKYGILFLPGLFSGELAFISEFSMQFVCVKCLVLYLCTGFNGLRKSNVFF